MKKKRTKKTRKFLNPYAARVRREDKKQRRKFARGGRVEAYTFGDALKSKRGWP